ncbi:MAG: hypothetical protein Q9M32_09005 [Sulfurimonas sp.]|nr:hypothetical protein [Sulfurimonas sp.]
MLDISKSIKALDESDIADNLLHYSYNTKHLLSLIAKGMKEDDPSFMSSFRSFEGEVFENFVYEKLLRYAESSDEIDKFLLKGYHQNKFKSHPNTLSISEKQQIVYRTKSREISEFDAMFLTKNNELYFVEMTLVKSVLKLRKRLRKKKALLEIIFPDLEIKALIILNEGATGVKQFPDYCKVWFTNEYSAKHVLDYIQNPKAKKLVPKEIINSKKMIQSHHLKVYPFRYYNTMAWITKTLRAHKKHILDIYFLMNNKVQRYHDLYNKLYIGFMSIDEASSILNLAENEYPKDLRVVVAIEKKYTDEIVLTYYIQKTRKNLYLYSFDEDNKMSKEKKDPYGITVTEVYHSNKTMDESYVYTMSDIKKVKKLLKASFLKNQTV